MPKTGKANEEFLESQLKRLGIKEDISKLTSLTVPPGETHVISTVDPKIKGAKWVKDVGYQLKPKSIVDIKKWIGIPDEVARQLHRPHSMAFSRIVSPEVLAKSKDSRHIVFGEAIARAKEYVMGDSTKISEAEISMIDSALHITNQICNFPIHKEIVIEHDATLVLGPDINAVICGDMIIKTGGKLVCQANSTSIWATSAKGKQ